MNLRCWQSFVRFGNGQSKLTAVGGIKFLRERVSFVPTLPAKTLQRLLVVYFTSAYHPVPGFTLKPFS